MTTDEDKSNGTAGWVRWAMGLLAAAILAGASTNLGLYLSRASEYDVQKVEAAVQRVEHRIAGITADRTIKWLDYERRQGTNAACLAEIKVKVERIQRDISELKAWLIRQKKAGS